MWSKAVKFSAVLPCFMGTWFILTVTCYLPINPVGTVLVIRLAVSIAVLLFKSIILFISAPQMPRWQCRKWYYICAMLLVTAVTVLIGLTYPKYVFVEEIASIGWGSSYNFRPHKSFSNTEGDDNKLPTRLSHGCFLGKLTLRHIWKRTLTSGHHKHIGNWESEHRAGTLELRKRCLILS